MSGRKSREKKNKRTKLIKITPSIWAYKMTPVFEYFTLWCVEKVAAYAVDVQIREKGNVSAMVEKTLFSVWVDFFSFSERKRKSNKSDIRRKKGNFQSILETKNKDF